MRNLIAKAAITVAVLGLAAPDMAGAYTRHHHHYGRYASARHLESCRNAERRRGNNGAVIGGIGGALAGNALSHGGGKLGGTLIGAGVGAVAGHAIAKRSKGDC
jgi:outer membrane lipoprotein SlyB